MTKKEWKKECHNLAVSVKQQRDWLDSLLWSLLDETEEYTAENAQEDWNTVMFTAGFDAISRLSAMSEGYNYEK